ncbi:MAG: efflux RND transporter periplasmic adaptor subunit [Endomicrobiia bacterium]|nr:efflux RND transporter periplasmic adaptor subunit [Endomicrobiaceae bacterium]MDD3053019.1 efflux RND transporter periplasmic adaptor subunit [Endomicrobiaceae bacterium]MDD3922155.1 efflux RND transporter periplasmic adaptor subunit [Endomicrobiaceae bacterium]MDD5101386.1 efflux RND transporter periplasmic adaptor subunit [Endomicrobiaceae bacterium]
MNFKHFYYKFLEGLIYKYNQIVARYPNFKKHLIITLFSILAVILGLIIYFVYIAKEKVVEEKQEIISVKVKKAVRQDYTDTYTVMGTIKGAVENEMRFELDGQLASYNYKEGSKIKQGDVICSLDPKDALTKADYAKSKYKSELSAYNSARERYKVYEELFNMKALSESKLYEAKYEIESSQSKVKASLSEVELSQSNLAKTNLIAPSDGILAEIIIKSGDYITPQDVVAKFISDKGTNFEVDIPEKDVYKLSIGQQVTINCDSYQGKDFLGKLTEIAPTVKERTRTSMIKVSVENEEGLLRSGMFGRGVILLKELKNVLLVPSDSIVSLNDNAFLVPVVTPDYRTPGEGIIMMRPCQLGEKLTDKTVIEQGLQIGELVVTETQGQLSDGMKVKFLEAIEDKVAETQK